jgi:hypothetical protein
MKVRNEAPVFAQMSGRARKSLGPFAAAFESVLLPYVWRECLAATANRPVSGIGRRIKKWLRTSCGYQVHPALVCYAMRLCCHHHRLAVLSKGRARDIEIHESLVDAAFGTIAKLEEYFGTYQLRLLLA